MEKMGKSELLKTLKSEVVDEKSAAINILKNDIKWLEDIIPELEKASDLYEVKCCIQKIVNAVYRLDKHIGLKLQNLNSYEDQIWILEQIK